MPRRQWIDGFRDCLARGERAAFRTLFSDEASLQMSPFEAPLPAADLGRAFDEFRARGQAGEWRAELWADAGDTAILHWSAGRPDSAPPAMQGDGLLILRFDDEGRCRHARQWHHWHPAGAPLATGFVENPPAPGR